MNNIKNPNLINSNVNYANKENNSLVLNTNKINSTKKLKLFNDDLQPFPEPKESSEKEMKLKKKSEFLDEEDELFPKFKESLEKEAKDKKNVNSFRTPIQEKTKKSVYFTDAREREIKVKLISEINLEYGIRPTTIFNIQDTKSNKPLDFSFHHVIDYKTLGKILNIVLNSKHVEGIEKIEFLNNIYKNLNKDKDLLKNYPENPDNSLKLLKSIIDLGVFSNSINIKEVLNNILLYFHGIGFIGPAEKHRPDALKAKNGFDRFGKCFFNSDAYSKLKKLQRKYEKLENNSNDINKMFKILLSLSKLEVNKYEEDQWYIEEISGKNYVLPKIMQNEPDLKEYLKAIKTINDLKQEIENLKSEIMEINNGDKTTLSEKKPIKTIGKFASDFINDFINKDKILKKEFQGFKGKKEEKLPKFMEKCEVESIKEAYFKGLKELNSDDSNAKLAIELKIKNNLLASLNNNLKIIENNMVAKFMQMTPETPIEKKVGLKFVPYK